MNALQRLALAALALLGPSCASSGETLFVPADSAEWSLAHQVQPNRLLGRPGLREFVPAGESIEAWSRLLTIQNLEGDSRAPRALMDGLRERMAERCPDVAWEVLDESEDSVSYEWSIEGCGDHDDQHELARITRGNLGLYRVALTAKGNSLDPELRAAWLETIDGAFVLDLATGQPAEID